MNQKDKFLQDVTKDIKYIFARNKIRKELENHILDGLDAGFSEDEVISDMGNPKIISNGFNQVYTSIHYLNLFLKITFIGLLTFTSHHYVRAKRTAVDYQKSIQLQPYEKEIINESIKDKKAVNQSIHLGHIAFHFKDAYLTQDKFVVIIYEFEKLNPLIHDSILYRIDSCNNQLCLDDSQIDFDSYYRDLRPARMGYLKFEAEEIPRNIELVFQHTLLNDVHRKIELETEVYYE